jgi:tRNA(Ile)-lysidine synthase
MKLRKLPFKVYCFLNEHGLIRPYDTVIIGVSGGPDSVALVNILHSVNFLKNFHLRLYIAHLNHQLRGRFSEEDEHFVRNLSETLSLPFIFKRVDIKGLAEKSNCSIEETARVERYRFFHEAVLQYKASAVAVGHTADDNAETVLHRIIRGTGMRGLGGIPLKRPLTPDSSAQVVRPLLGVWRSEIIEYLGKECINYRTDASNYEAEYLRNKIRLELIPLLENRYNPGIKKALLQLCHTIASGKEYLSTEAKKTATSAIIEATGDSCVIDAQFLSSKPKILQYFVIQEALDIMHVPLKEIRYEHFAAIEKEINRPGGKGLRVQLPGGFSLWREYNRLCFAREPLSVPGITQSRLTKEIIIKIPGETFLDSLGRIVSEILPVHNISFETYKKTKTKDEEVFDLQNITMPLAVRTRKNGDSISPLGLAGHKKLKDIFMDKKIPLELRDSMPIVVMRDQPIWIVGICMENRVRVTSDTKKILKLTFHRPCV